MHAKLSYWMLWLRTCRRFGQIHRGIRLEQTKLAGDLYKLTEDRVRQGVSAPLESNRAMQQVNSLEQQRQEADNDYIPAKLSLAEILQVHITSDFEVDDSTAYGSDTSMDRDAAVKNALTSRPDYLAAQAM